MRHLLSIFFSIVFLSLQPSVSAQNAPSGSLRSPSADSSSLNAINSTPEAKEAIDQAFVALSRALVIRPFQASTVGVLPLKDQASSTLFGENGNYFVSHLTNILATGDYSCVVVKEDAAWDELVKQIAWNERKDDILDPKTVSRFGKQMAAEVLLYGSISRITDYHSYLTAEITVYAIDVAKATHCWGGTFTGRVYKGQDIKGLVTLDSDLRDLFGKAFEAAKKDLATPAVQRKLSGMSSIAVLPIVGDIDQYATQMAESAIVSQSHLTAINITVPTVDMACRSFGSNGRPEADAVFQGTLRDASVSYSSAPEYLVHKAGDTEYYMARDWVKRVEFHLSIIRSTDKAVLWSLHIPAEMKGSDRRPLSSDEKQKLIKEKHDHFFYVLTHPLCPEASPFCRAGAFVIIGVLAIIILLALFKGILMMAFRR